LINGSPDGSKGALDKLLNTTYMNNPAKKEIPENSGIPKNH
jgi:hypothetical protein